MASFAFFVASASVRGIFEQVCLALGGREAIGGGVAKGLLEEAYAQKVVDWERSPAKMGRFSTFEKAALEFFVARDGTKATAQGQRHLVEPCIDLARRKSRKPFPAEVNELWEDVRGASDWLKRCQVERPSVLLSVCHGAARPHGGWKNPGDERRLQGALEVGLGASGDTLLTAEQIVGNEPFLPGGIWFAIACFGAGTPAKSAYDSWLRQLREAGQYKESVQQVLESLPKDGEKPFLAALPKAVLQNPNGPLAFFGHLDLAWTCAFTDMDGTSRASRIFSALHVLANGNRAGVALDALMRAYREVNDELLAGYQVEQETRLVDASYKPNMAWRARAFMLRNDLRGYVLLGDPAARLPLAQNWPSVEAKTLPSVANPRAPEMGLSLQSAAPNASLDFPHEVGQTRVRMKKPALLFPRGIDDFRELREKNFAYIDKSFLISEVLDRHNVKVILVPRPRRFGKTLNLTMLKWYFEKREENLWHLFEGLHIATAGEAYRQHFQKYPVIHLSFKGTKADTWDECFHRIKWIVREAFEVHQSTLGATLGPVHAAEFHAMFTGTVGNAEYALALYNLTKFLHEVHGVRPMVLIDEYDAPIHAGYVQGYYDKVVSFFRSFLEAGLKDNVHLERAFLTGILRVSKESIFSGLNNPGVYSLLEPEFNTCFGFTESEVQGLMAKAGLSDLMPAVRSFYDGYDFGGMEIYNPWSILEFLASDSRKLRPFWVNTSQNDLTKRLLRKHAFTVEKDIETLMTGGKIEKRLDDAIVFPDLERYSDTLWSILALTGYLKASVPERYRDEHEVMPYELSIPNVEVAYIYRQTFKQWLDDGLTTQGGDVQKLTNGLLAGDIPVVQEQLQKLVLAIPSYHNTKGVDCEKFFHGLVIGLLATLEPDYEVRADHESGHGRPDVMIKPRRIGTSGVVMELKAAKKSAKKTLKQALAEGHQQFAENDYTADLRAAGLTTIHSLVVAFDGKKVVVESADKPPKKKATAKKKAAGAKRSR